MAPFARDRGHVNFVHSGKPDEPRILSVLRYLLSELGATGQSRPDKPDTLGDGQPDADKLEPIRQEWFSHTSGDTLVVRTMRTCTDCGETKPLDAYLPVIWNMGQGGRTARPSRKTRLPRESALSKMECRRGSQWRG